MKIKPIEVFSTQDADNNSKFNYKEVRKLEANYQEAIDALKNIIDYEIYVAIQEKCSDKKTEKIIHKYSIGIIEKAYGKSWEELKE